MRRPGRIGLVLSGGGARAAYQVGVLLGIAKLLPDPAQNPFPIICGTSAGAINAVALASGAANYQLAVATLAKVWKQLHIQDVYDVSTSYFLKTFLHFGVSLLSAGHVWRNPQSFLDNAPLRDTLGRAMPFDAIGGAIDSGALQALALTASCYTTGMSVTFFQGQDKLEEWTRYQRLGIRERIGLDHLMATAAIPLIFPSVRIGEKFYCDGAVRQLSPLSPALHLGAEKLFVVGLASQRPDTIERRSSGAYPMPAQIFGHLLNSVFIDSMAVDMERLSRINHTVSLLQSSEELASRTQLKKVEIFQLNPSKSLEGIVFRHTHLFPPFLRFIMKGTGATRQRGTALATYLLFEPEYCRELIALGYRDTLQQKEEIRNFLEL
ncbi:patatin-like phospholipase family protein [Chromobacterium subtsugae]|uniref:Patatin-like phospholipase family protein n=3 Tax=Chromobacterium subtsugae TaxID=251747 RepID=A0ABS7FAU3_9NEIS|nr:MULTISPECIES: patatin-like phospholipase family protein [Chromobacterium]KUM02963.1 patatin [Chromobacterium subtsugae]KZE87260.1 patatin [Chromobacterium sp. F49]MBW7565783.1 patatin-like phospholipase family protein [Chromobacterium subtsugae]MBW8287177.1 patatin-like phospholipase family protein [Chromobacterium subtsugae]OBU88078.1 patatin [Chromobacterium subtsugae]